ncbi:MAG: retropepsin-like domain-containing protein [Candidatus Aenigmarchaeota archaeon]|nr:retropepsin-like domain-containing protein [Candidatus Aenigmarchaeota archaeon]
MQVEQEIELCDERRDVCKRKFALFDTGAKSSYIDEDLAIEFGYSKFDRPREITLATKDKKATILGDIVLRVILDDCEMPSRTILNVIEGLTKPIVLGTDFMELFDIE